MTSPDSPDGLWRDSEPSRAYDVVLVGAGPHTLATAYHLAVHHEVGTVAVLDDGWSSSGDAEVIAATEPTGHHAAIQRDALGRWARLGAELDDGSVFDRCGMLSLAHTARQVNDGMHRVYAHRLGGIRGDWLDPARAREVCPPLDVSPDVRYPVLGGAWQPGAGIAEPDTVTTAYARRAARAGVELIRGCSVIDLLRDGDRVTGVRTDAGDIVAGRIGFADAGPCGPLLEEVGVRVPVRSHAVRALVSEQLAPVLPIAVVSDHARIRIRQTRRGELVMDADSRYGYRGRGSVHVIEEQLAAAVELFPALGPVHLVDRPSGIVDTTPDGLPILGATAVENLFLNRGWGTAAFAATPTAGRLFAHVLANGTPHPLAGPFGMERFADEASPRRTGSPRGEQRPVTV
ncbi:FAD-dependent oxidoreductase [Pseudonocardia spinosispora]|uniref:FAD-dependent oxidoreductase n=1 Tax=Pseudonocardia spinosispora TaxID=103441 RepID=UPI000408BF7C|nr:FAD-dependent oxidoreductase [Pseudonocardia spinosispora]